MIPNSNPHAPKVFVSSTCYDLRDLRASLDGALRTFGVEPILSDHPSFPINPDETTTDACRRVVQDVADIFILIVGGRYGSIDKRSDKSITNIEYLTARTKGIPIYVFVQADVLVQLEIYLKNPAADFSSFVDDTRLFDFINSLKNEEKAWVFSFRTGADVEAILRLQLSNLFAQCLNFRKKILANDLEWMQRLDLAVVRLLLDKPFAWEYMVFPLTASRGIDRFKERRELHKRGITYGQGERIQNIVNYAQQMLSELTNLATSLTSILNGLLPDALGPPGVPADQRMLVLCGEQVSQLYGEMLAWSERVRKAYVDEELVGLKAVLAAACDPVLEQMESFFAESLQEIQAASQTVTNEQVVIKKTLTFDPSGIQRFNEATRAHFGLNINSEEDQ